MKIDERQEKLVEIVRQKGKASVEELAERLGISKETIRRDLTSLAERGAVLKYHGGAKATRMLGEGSFRQRMSENVAAKTRVAKAAAALFHPGETLLIDTGSTTLFFAEEIARVSGLTIVTNSTEIARAVARTDNGSRVFLLGGEFGIGNSQTLGIMVTEQLRAFRAHHAVLTVGALDSRNGAMDYSIDEAQIARVMIEQSERLTVLADASKFRALASFEVCPLSRVDCLVCEDRPPDDLCAKLEETGGEIVLAPPTP